ncbi:hypothetical protein FQR65_LT14071 [Abscondita terminalis]|nr:hypothetical protein FQR65_LT14071 [Abscondita terminalis]
MSSSSSNKIADNEMQSVQVFVRIRPALENESPIHSLETTSNDVVVEANYQKKFTFDKVFSEKSTQSHVYNSAVKPFVSDIISGYNCTLVTYGTTFTGKTYTMYGVIPNTATSSGSLENVAIQDSFRIDTHEECGMIPRVVSDLFTELANRQISHSVACTYYQLRNEELCDLLSDDSHQLKIYDDRRNKGAVRIVGLREIYVKNKFELFKLLNKVHQKTIPNEKSGCHSIFTLKTTIHQKGFDCDNYIKIGKLCMVDLASSDNTSKSEVNRRVRDNSRASLSLLTFQRVITALWEKNAHVPFRDSKLTRILQDSFGGKSKTSIITTISPMTGSSDDILCTLECAQRARTIFNKPEVNKMLLFKEFFNHYIDENSSTRKDLEASRNRDGVLIHQENFQKMLTDKKLQKESLSQLRLLVADLKNSKKERKLQTENFLIYVKNVSSDFSADLDYYHKLCNENTQHNELLQSQQLELYNKSKSVLSSCVDKVSARRCVFSNAGDLNICLDKVKQSLNSRSEVFDQVLDLENQRESSLEDFEGCSKGDDCESCKVASESLLEFEESVDDTPVVDNLLFKEIAQENMNGYSETCELEDSLMHLKEKLIQQIKSTYETVITQVMDVKKENA